MFIKKDGSVNNYRLKNIAIILVLNNLQAKDSIVTPKSNNES